MAVEGAVAGGRGVAAGLGGGRHAHGFSAEDAGHADGLALAGGTVVAAQPVAELGEQGVVGDAGQIVHIHEVREFLAAGGPDSDKGGAASAGPDSHGGFGGDLVAGVDDGGGIGGHEGFPVVGGDEVVNAMHMRLRVVAGDAFAHGVDLGLPEGGIGGMDLAVDVGFSHVIHVDEGESPYPGACQGLGCPGAHPPDADHHHMGVGNAARTLCTIEPGRPAKAARVIGREQGRSGGSGRRSSHVMMQERCPRPSLGPSEGSTGADAGVSRGRDAGRVRDACCPVRVPFGAGHGDLSSGEKRERRTRRQAAAPTVHDGNHRRPALFRPALPCPAARLT